MFGIIDILVIFGFIFTLKKFISLNKVKAFAVLAFIYVISIRVYVVVQIKNHDFSKGRFFNQKYLTNSERDSMDFLKTHALGFYQLWIPYFDSINDKRAVHYPYVRVVEDYKSYKERCLTNSNDCLFATEFAIRGIKIKKIKKEHYDFLFNELNTLMTDGSFRLMGINCSNKQRVRSVISDYLKFKKIDMNPYFYIDDYFNVDSERIFAGDECKGNRVTSKALYYESIKDHKNLLRVANSICLNDYQKNKCGYIIAGIYSLSSYYFHKRDKTTEDNEALNELKKGVFRYCGYKDSQTCKKLIPLMKKM